MTPREALLGTRDFSARHVQDTRASNLKALSSNKGGFTYGAKRSNFDAHTRSCSATQCKRLGHCQALIIGERSSIQPPKRDNCWEYDY
ncbi:hypothetical protein BCR43DRAFT_236587 [Syncephalastrum racemosum]|nr:hypothetical protein BCR43DRAFT_236587 [Syncephalastrum racemosum]